MAVPITGTIVPTDPTDIYAVIDPIWGIDGLRSVADSTARNAITTLRRRLGMFVVLQSDLTVWQLNTATNTGTDADWTEFTGGGGGGTIALSGDATGSGTSAITVTVGSIGGEAVTLAGALATSGAHPLTLTTTGSTNVTLPTSGTLVTTAVTTLSSLVITESQVTGLVSALSAIASEITAIEAATIDVIAGTGLSGGGSVALGGSLTLTSSGNQTITLSGDATGSGTTAITTTLATVNSNTTAVGSSTSIPTITANAKGLVTSVTGNVVIAPAGTLTGTTLASNVVTSSLTTVGTIATGTWQGTAITGTYIASSVALAGSPTTTTQTALDDSTKVATTAYVDAAVAAGGGGGSGTIEPGNTGNLAVYTTNGGTTLEGETPSAMLDGALGSTQGDILIRGASDWAALGPGTSGQVLVTGGASANPAWGSVAASILPNPSSSTLGGVQSAASVSHEWINSISTSGVPSLSQPAFTDISGTATAAQLPTTGLTITQHAGTITTDTEASNAVTVNLATSDWHLIVLTGSITTFTLSNPTVGQQFTLYFQQAATGGPYSVTTWFTGTIDWFGSPYSAPSMPTTASAFMTCTFKCVSSGVYLAWWLGNSAA